MLQDKPPTRGCCQLNGVRCLQEQVENAAGLANAHSFIQDLPQGYDTLVRPVRAFLCRALCLAHGML